jgi:hypothetical protein
MAHGGSVTTAAPDAVDPMQENAERGVAFVRVLAAVLTRLVETNDEVRVSACSGLHAPYRALEPQMRGRQGCTVGWCWVGGPPCLSGATLQKHATFGRPRVQTGAEPEEITKFHALRPPSISVADYLERYVPWTARASRRWGGSMNQCGFLVCEGGLGRYRRGR